MAGRRLSARCTKLATIIGSCIILFPNGVFIYWGNMAAYVLSYAVFQLSTTSGIAVPWVVSLHLSCWTCGLMVYHTVVRYVGERWTAVLGLGLTNLGIGLSYVTVQHSFLLLNVTFGVLVGAGTGFLHSYALQILLTWASDDVGLTVSFCQGSFGWGALIITQLMTAYINPNNIEPNVLIGNAVYYTQTEVLDRVPSAFLVLACFSVPVQVIGILLMKPNTGDRRPTGSHSAGSLEKNALEDLSDHHHYGSNASTQKEDQKLENAQSGPLSDSDGHPGTSVSNQTPSESPDLDLLSPRQVLRMPSFYALWTVYFFAELPFLLLSNYYKSFGQLWIRDDHFLTDLSTVMSAVNSGMRIFWGVIMDKIGVKNCLVMEVTIVITISFWYYFTAMADRWLYFFVTIILASMTGAHYGACIYVVVQVFGKAHFATKFGFMGSSAIAFNFLAPFLIDFILVNYGWFYVYTSAGFLNFLSLLLIFYFVP